MNDRTQFTLSLTDVGGCAPAERRLARLLKAALRLYGFRAVEVRETTGATPAAATQDAAAQTVGEVADA